LKGRKEKKSFERPAMQICKDQQKVCIAGKVKVILRSCMQGCGYQIWE